MELKTIKISANGKLIISGEHSVLYGYPCISTAINKKIHVKISQRIDNEITINSKEFGTENFNLKTTKKVQNWCKYIYFLSKKLSKTGLNIDIKSAIPSGCGSSGALFACISCGLLLIKDSNLTQKQLLKKTLKLYFEFHKNDTFKPSGIDIITSIIGGIIYYNPKKKIIKQLPLKFFDDIKMYAIYTEHKTSTENTVNIANKVKNCNEIYSKIGKITQKIKSKIELNNYVNFDSLIAKNQELLEELKLLDNDGRNIIKQCQNQDIITKISGSGLGDYIIAFKHKKQNLQLKNYKLFDIKIPKKGIQYNIKTSFFAPINIALIKYWGKRDEELNLPMSSSISISSKHLGTITNIQQAEENTIIFNSKKINQNSDFYKKTFQFIQIFKQQFHIKNNTPIKITTLNNIPTASGLASSASGFASLTLALNDFFDTNLNEKQLSQIARLGSGSASRSVFQNVKFIKWNKGIKQNGSDCFAEKINIKPNNFKANIELLVLILSKKKKKISSREAMKLTVKKSKTYQKWLEQTEKDFKNLMTIKTFKKFGETIENNCILMHKTINEVGINYFNKKTYKIIDIVKHMRENKINVYFTIDAGANIVLVFNKKNRHKIINFLLTSKLVNKKNILMF